MVLSTAFNPRRRSSSDFNSDIVSLLPEEVGEQQKNTDDALNDLGVDECCRGIINLELWGSAVKWGSDFKFNSSKECCLACKAMCSGGDGPCLCDSWVFCGNRETCGPKFGEVELNFCDFSALFCL